MPREAHRDPIAQWRHDHVFDQDQKRAGEARTLLVVVITAVMMVVEIFAGLIYGSMALLADGLHMASHAAALGIAVLAYVISRRLARDRSFTFGVGKINSLAGFTSAVLLLGFAPGDARQRKGSPHHLQPSPPVHPFGVSFLGKLRLQELTVLWQVIQLSQTSPMCLQCFLSAYR